MLALSVVFVLVTLSACAADDLVASEEAAWRAAVAVVEDSVVQICLIGGLERVDNMLLGSGPTTGLIVSKDGYIVSSAFQFAQKPSSILVILPDGQRLSAKLVATDHSRLIVLLKVEPKKPLAIPPMAGAGEVYVGQWTIAVGRTFREDVPNTSVGVVSALGRMQGRAIQTDAKISSANYGGPLIDLRGRVLGLLVPMTPGSQSKVAGAQWYDSGIGFAVPMAHILAALPRLQAGKDLHPGLLGVSLAKGAAYRVPPRIAAVRQTSPAKEADIRTEDVVLAVNGRAVNTVTQFKAALGPCYASETVRLTLKRDKGEITKDVKLVAELPPLHHGFLGILLERVAVNNEDEETIGVPVRYVYPNSPAAAAGLARGDRITKINGQSVASVTDVRAAMSGIVKGDVVAVEWLHKGKREEQSITTIGLPETLPADDLPLPAKPQAAVGMLPEVGAFDLKLPEMPNECRAFVPPAYRPNVTYGLFVWLHAAGDNRPEPTLDRWKTACQENRVILLLPQATNPSEWQPTESEYLLKLVSYVRRKYAIDPARIVIGGVKAGGRMAYMLAVGKQNVFRGIAVVDAPLPRMARTPASDPLNRLAVYSAAASESRSARKIARGIDRLRAAGVPVTEVDLGETHRPLGREEQHALARWIDTLDRL